VQRQRGAALLATPQATTGPMVASRPSGSDLPAEVAEEASETAQPFSRTTLFGLGGAVVAGGAVAASTVTAPFWAPAAVVGGLAAGAYGYITRGNSSSGGTTVPSPPQLRPPPATSTASGISNTSPAEPKKKKKKKKKTPQGSTKPSPAPIVGISSAPSPQMPSMSSQKEASDDDSGWNTVTSQKEQRLSAHKSYNVPSLGAAIDAHTGAPSAIAVVFNKYVNGREAQGYPLMGVITSKYQTLEDRSRGGFSVAVSIRDLNNWEIHVHCTSTGAIATGNNAIHYKHISNRYAKGVSIQLTDRQERLMIPDATTRLSSRFF